MSREGRVAGGGVLTQVIGWVAGGGRVGGRRGEGGWQEGVGGEAVIGL